jgi:hypothetical protein
MKKVLLFLVNGLICLFITINVSEAQKAFQQGSGPDHLVVMEAENFHENIPGTAVDVEGEMVTHTWEKIDTTAGFSGTGSMISWPDVGVTNSDVDWAQKNSACLKYRVNFNTTGPHYIWIRHHASFMGGSSKSYHIGFGDTISVARMDITAFHNVFIWETKAAGGINPVTVDIPTVGVHTFSIYMRQDGAQIDKILFTTNDEYEWSLPQFEMGPDESPRSQSVGISRINDNNKFSMSIYPNPSYGNTHLNFGSNKVEDVDITIFNFVGQKLISKSYKSIPLANGIDLPTQSLEKGIYLIQCKIAGQTQTAKFIIK